MKIDKLAVATKAVFLAPDNTVLMLREASTNPNGVQVGSLHIPGGRIELGESVEQGLIREIREETGIDISSMNRQLFEVSEWRPKIRDEQWHIIALFFLIKTEKPEVTLSLEHDAVEWVSLDDYTNNPRVLSSTHKVFKTLKTIT